MIPLPQFSNRSVGVLGLGACGMAAVKALEESGARVFAWDGDESRRAEVGEKAVPPAQWPFERLAAVVLADGARAGLSRGVVQKASHADVTVLTDLDLLSLGLTASPHADAVKVVAVTGAAGKSVTVSIISHILSEQGYEVAIGGQLGSPFLALPAPQPKRVYVLELPVRRLATARRLRADVSVVLSIASPGPKEQLDLAIRSVLRVFRGQTEGDTAIIGVDDALGQNVCTLLKSNRADITCAGQVIPVSGEVTLSHGVFVLENVAYSAERGKTKVLGDFSRSTGFLGSHFNQDAAAAVAACLALDVPPEMTIKALHSYEGLNGRFECIGAAGPVLFVDDTFASSPAAAERAVSACPSVFWIRGGEEIDGAAPAISQGADIISTYRLDAATRGVGEIRQSMSRALHRAYSDAAAFAAEDPEAVPVILFAPGIPAGRAGITSSDFRNLAAPYLSEAATEAANVALEKTDGATIDPFPPSGDAPNKAPGEAHG